MRTDLRYQKDLESLARMRIRLRLRKYYWIATSSCGCFGRREAYVGSEQNDQDDEMKCFVLGKEYGDYDRTANSARERR